MRCLPIALFFLYYIFRGSSSIQARVSQMYTHQRVYIYVFYVHMMYILKRMGARKIHLKMRFVLLALRFVPFCLRSIIALDDRNKGKLKFPFAGGPLQPPFSDPL